MAQGLLGSAKRLVKISSLAARRLAPVDLTDPNGYLKSCKGVVHVGANAGQEAKTYAALDLPVVWIEPIPEVFQKLEKNISPFSDQIALKELITDRDGATVTLNVASNNGASSSILDLKEHKDIWPHVGYVGQIECTSVTLPTALGRAGVNVKRYDALVMDTQGSELMVLKGAVPLLSGFRFIKTEAADFESYKDCTTVDELEAFLAGHGFKLVRKYEFARREAGGAYFDLLFERAP